jgi:hypothetical protein
VKQNKSTSSAVAATAPTVQVRISPPNFQMAEFPIAGDILVIHRFSEKARKELAAKQLGLKLAGSGKVRTVQVAEDVCNAARYISPEGWDGFPASAIRKAMIRACSLVDVKMTLARMSIFTIQDGWDAAEPQIPLVRIIGKHTLQEDLGRVANGNPYVIWRPAYHNWKARVRIRWDAKQFTLTDVTNLMSIVGQQVGLCEGRPSSESGGMGWGLFEIDHSAASNGEVRKVKVAA